MGVLWFDGDAVEDAEPAGEFLAKGFGGFGSDDGVGVNGYLRRCGFSGADGPDRFVGDHESDGFLGRDFVESAQTMGMSPASMADLSLRLTVSSVSPKYWRRSECPMMTWVTPTASNMLAHISPV